MKDLTKEEKAYLIYTMQIEISKIKKSKNCKPNTELVNNAYDREINFVQNIINKLKDKE